jgi:hypothetical protein
VKDKKIIYKEDLLKVTKEIWRPGSELRKPAKYDELFYRIKKIENTEFDEEILKSVKESEKNLINLGLDEEKEWLI